MFHSQLSKLGYRWMALALCAAILAGFAAAVAPRSAQAVTCERYYYVQKGDTTPRIAHTFGLKWKQIAIANNLEQPYKLTIGQKLCIPPADFNPEPAQTAKTSTTKVTVIGLGSWLRVTASGFRQTSVFYVKVRPSTVWVRGWYKIGMLRVEKNKEASYLYHLPDELLNDNYLTLCLKHGTTDELICRTVYNP